MQGQPKVIHSQGPEAAAALKDPPNAEFSHKWLSGDLQVPVSQAENNYYCVAQKWTQEN